MFLRGPPHSISITCEPELSGEEMSVLGFLFMKSAGGESIGRVIVSLLSMRSTVSIVGLSAECSCAQSKPMLIHFFISLLGPPFNMGSTTFSAVPSLQFLHAYTNSLQ